MSQRREWEATELPLEWRAQVIDQFHVEFLNYDRVISTGDEQRDAMREGKVKNHVIIRVSFVKSVAGISGARISMDVVLDDVGSNEAVYAGSDAGDEPLVKEGLMNVKLVRYTGQSNSAVRTFRFPLRRDNTTLGELLDVAISRRMHLFQFTIIFDFAYMGCRDFITQYFHQIQAAGLVETNTTDGSNRSFNQIIPWRYSPTEVESDSSTSLHHGGAVRETPSAIDSGIFRYYQRVTTSDMDYS